MNHYSIIHFSSVIKLEMRSGIALIATILRTHFALPFPQYVVVHCDISAIPFQSEI